VQSSTNPLTIMYQLCWFGPDHRRSNITVTPLHAGMPGRVHGPVQKIANNQAAARITEAKIPEAHARPISIAASAGT
jgi:hypothetical protein